jgi:hypothetical protein
MGLRNWIMRPMKGRHVGVQDLTAGGSGIPVGNPAPISSILTIAISLLIV